MTQKETKETKSDKSLLSEDYRIVDKTALVTKKYADGSEQVIYLIDGVAYEKRADGNGVTAISIGGANDGQIIFAEHYPGCDWLQARYYVGTEQQREQSCLHFRKPATSKPPEGVNPQYYDGYVTYFEREAWTDAETGLPVLFRQGLIRGTYQHEPPNEEPIVIPEEITQAIKHYNGES